MEEHREDMNDQEASGEENYSEIVIEFTTAGWQNNADMVDTEDLQFVHIHEGKLHNFNF